MADPQVDLDEEAGEGGGSAPERSGTKYPGYGLEEAAQLAGLVRTIGGSEAREEDLLKHLNVSRTTKSWIYKSSSVKLFGLWERRGRKDDARFVLTDLGKRLLYPGDETEASLARITAFFTPPLYRPLFERYRGAPTPTVQGLANVLFRDFKILESVAPQAAEAFTQSLRYAGLITSEGHVDEPRPRSLPGQSPTPATSQETRPTESLATQLSVDSPRSLAVPTDFIVHTFLLRRKEGVLQLQLPLPADLTSRDVGRIHKWMQTLPLDDEDETA